ncbi:MAG: class F sortase [Nocardioides sp.]
MTTSSNDRAGRGRHPWWLVALGAVLVAAGLVAWFAQDPGVTTDPASAGSPAAASATPEQLPSATPGRWVPGAPRLLVVPALHVRAPVEPIRAPGGTLIPPSDPTHLGWWSDGAQPGAKRGSALITGHTVHTGGGAFDHLATLHRGDRVKLRTSHGWIRYNVTRVHVYAKGTIAKQAKRLFSQRVPGRLVLITCDDWNGSIYLSNAVVTAEPVG